MNTYCTIRPIHAVGFAAISGILGLAILYHEVNGVTAALGAANVILYTLVYTPMKRISIVNTWIGSVGKHIFHIYVHINVNVRMHAFIRVLRVKFCQELI